MAEVEMAVEVNPLTLSLDEVIALNRTKNKAAEEKDDSISLENYMSQKSENYMFQKPNRPNRFFPKKSYRPREQYNLLTRKALRVNDRLRNIPGFGSRSIHNRLGYFRVQKKKFQNKDHRANKIVFKYKYHRWIKSRSINNVMNPKFKVKNPNAYENSFLPPLTKKSISKFNSLNGNVCAQSYNGSIASSSRPIFRHSIKKSLDPQIQSEMEDLLLTSGMTVLEYETLESFRPCPEKTILTINDRFSSYF